MLESWREIVAPVFHLGITTALAIWLNWRLGKQTKALEILKPWLSADHERLRALREAVAEINWLREEWPDVTQLSQWSADLQFYWLREADKFWDAHLALVHKFAKHLDAKHANEVFAARERVKKSFRVPDYARTGEIAAKQLEVYAAGVQCIAAAFEEQRNALDASLKGS